MTAKTPIHGLRRPDSSAMAPSTGDSRAMTMAETVAMLLHAACAETGSSVSRATK